MRIDEKVEARRSEIWDQAQAIVKRGKPVSLAVKVVDIMDEIRCINQWIINGHPYQAQLENAWYLLGEAVDDANYCELCGRATTDQSDHPLCPDCDRAMDEMNEDRKEDDPEWDSQELWKLDL